MRVTWVHPSWRDLVIEDLAADAARRVAFLRACELAGVQLALSTEGGAAGARNLPLLVADDDFDALGDTMHRLCLQLAQPDLERLIASLEAALDRAAGDRAAGELRALAELALTTVQRRLDHERAAIEPSLLESWLAIWRRLPAPRPKVPQLAHTWAVLDPGEIDLEDFCSLARIDAFLAFAELLAGSVPEELGRMRFREQHAALLETVLDFAESLESLSEEVRVLVERVAAVDHRYEMRVVDLMARRGDAFTLPEHLSAWTEPVSSMESDRVRRIMRDL
jgi:hypothetical protein